MFNLIMNPNVNVVETFISDRAERVKHNARIGRLLDAICDFYPSDSEERSAALESLHYYYSDEITVVLMLRYFLNLSNETVEIH